MMLLALKHGLEGVLNGFCKNVKFDGQAQGSGTFFFSFVADGWDLNPSFQKKKRERKRIWGGKYCSGKKNSEFQSFRLQTLGSLIA